MRPQRILVINPNSNESVTRGIESALRGAGRHPDLEIRCLTLSKGPFGIESDADIQSVEPLLEETVRQNPQFEAYVIACYSDPGLEKCRRLTPKPVLGIQQSALATALALGLKFGVLALSAISIERHLKYIRSLGWEHSLAGERPLNLSVDQAANDSGTLGRIVSQGRHLIEQDGAGVLILGCTGLARHRKAAEEILQIPVIDPTQAAVALAAGRLLG